MKKIIAFIFLFNSTICFAQNKNEFNVQLGYSQACQVGGTYPISNWKQNIHNGFVNLEYYRNINNKSAIGIGVQMVEKGFRNAYTLPEPTYNYNVAYFFKMDYVEFPLMYRHTFKIHDVSRHFIMTGYRKFYFTTGAITSYLVKSGQGTHISNDYGNGKIQQNIGSSYTPLNYNKIDVGVMLRIGCEIRKNIILNFSYTQGLIKPYVYPSGELNYNGVFLVGLSYNFCK